MSDKSGFSARHSVLDRQLRKLGLQRDVLPQDLKSWQNFLIRVENAYKQHDDERYTLTRSLELTSSEMSNLYERLRKSSQQQLALERDKLQAIISSIGEGLALLSDAGVILFINPQGCALLDSDKDNLIGSNFFDYLDLSIEERNRAFQTLFEIQNISLETFLNSNHANSKDGKLPIGITTATFIAGASSVRGMVVVFRDISLQLAAKENIKKERDQAERDSAHKSDFLAAMSHEIRAPLNGILSLVDLLLDSELNDEQQLDIETIKDCADSLKSLINNVLDLSKIEAGMFFLDATAMNLNSTLKKILGQFRGAALKRNITLRLATTLDLPDKIKLDHFRLEQIISNLISNAIKFSPDNSVVNLSVDLKEESNTQKMLHISVKDSGKGIPYEKQSEIFEAYAQAGTSDAEKKAGTGLGLAICSKLIALMGGRIWLNSTPDIGSEFHFTVAFESLSEANVDNKITLNSSLTDPKTDNLHYNKSSKILLVDDNPINQNTISRMLMSKGHKVEIAGNGKEALEHTSLNYFDIILMDLHMPLMGGLEAIQKLRQMKGHTSEVPIIVLTADVIKDTKEKCLATGANEYISKPIDYNLLFQTIEKLRVKHKDSSNG